MHYKNFVYVLPGTTPTFASVFLSRNLVTYTWIVTPTEIDDVYIFTLEADFETHVPVPILTIEPNVLDLRVLECTPFTRIDFNITNHGFIRAGILVHN